MTKAIIFDLGGVLVDLDFSSCVKHFKEDIGYDKITEILDPSHQKGIYSDLEEGLLPPDAFRNLILSESRPGSTPEQVDRCMWSLLVGMDSYKVQYLNDLSKKYGLYILSNNNPVSMQRCHEVFTLSGLDYKHVFKKEFISYQMKLLKPGQAIYREVVRQIGFPADQLLFIDDSLSNVQAAESVGIPSLHYKQSTDLVSQLNAKLEELGC
jgi:FMN phosphatase YigB (HAD superfamily)